MRWGGRSSSSAPFGSQNTYGETQTGSPSQFEPKPQSQVNSSSQFKPQAKTESLVSRRSQDGRDVRNIVCYNSTEERTRILEVQNWFESHVKLDGKPYFLDYDQARAVTDLHKNTLVTARAGSGKTRVIVAKVVYLVSRLGFALDEIAVFMFNRTAAAEVNDRVATVEIDGRPLCASTPPAKISLASTFHKFALDLVKDAGLKPQIISEFEQNSIIARLLYDATTGKYHFPPREYQDLAKLTHNFIARAGQKYPGRDGLEQLISTTNAYLRKYQRVPEKQFACQVHKIALEVYINYLKSLQPPRIDFNIMMDRAAKILQNSIPSARNILPTPQNLTIGSKNILPAPQNSPTSSQNSPINSENMPQISRIRHFKYLMVDEYQDFSDLFYNLVIAIRLHCPDARLFAVGDDWQAINRFAGSDVNYFLHFDNYFPEDPVNIPLATNYRSHHRIVENANHYMLSNYDPTAIPAIPHNRKLGKICHQDPARIRFDSRDQLEDGLGDGIYQDILYEVMQLSDDTKLPISAAKTLKTLTKICHKHRHQSIMLLHRHNFTSINGLTLETLATALQVALARQVIMTETEFAERIRFLTMHRSKGLESEVVIILEADAEIIASAHPHATMFELFGDTRAAEIADQQRLLYVAMTRAKEQLYILSSDKKPLI